MATPLILYDNVLRTWPAPSNSGSVLGANLPQNLTDGRDFTLYVYRGSGYGTSVVSYDITEAKTIDAWAYFVANVSADSSTIELSYTRSGVNTVITSATGALKDRMKILKFTPVELQAGDVVKLSFSGDQMYVRQIYVGKVLEPPQGQYNSMTNPNNKPNMKINSVISRTGDVISRTIAKEASDSNLEISHVTESWYRTYWEPFAVHAQRKPFFYLPDPLVDSDAVFSTASAVVPGQPMGIGDLFSVKWKLSSVTKDSLYVL